jgi:outer membrane lipoprotein SlyB
VCGSILDSPAAPHQTLDEKPSIDKEIKMWTNKLRIVLTGTFVLALAACGTPNRTASTSETIPVTNTSSAGTSSASGYGVIQSIDLVQRQNAGIGLGTVAGAVVGGVLGNQVGGGSGRTAATVAGAAGGAYAGHQMQNNSRAADQSYRVSVRMDNGSIQTLVQDTQPNLQIGERVRLANGAIVERFR